VQQLIVKFLVLQIIKQKRRKDALDRIKILFRAIGDYDKATNQIEKSKENEKIFTEFFQNQNDQYDMMDQDWLMIRRNGYV
jgi:hypothetical protein